MVINLKEHNKYPYLQIETKDLLAEIIHNAVLAETPSVRKMIRADRSGRPSEHVERFAYIFPNSVQGEKE